jgi:hypothetical protein
MPEDTERELDNAPLYKIFPEPPEDVPTAKCVIVSDPDVHCGN